MTGGKATGWWMAAGAIVVVIALWWHQSHGKQGGGGAGAGFTKKWEFAGAGRVNGSLALGADGTLYAASEDGFLYAVDPAGNQQWTFSAGPMLAAPAVGADGTIYITNTDEKIFAVNRDGTQQWAFGGGPFADKSMGQIAAALDQNYIYTPWRAGLHAMRLTSGYSDWTAGVGFKRSGSVSVLSNGVVVYSGVGRLDAVYENGRTLWQYPVMDPPMTVDMITRNNGRIPAGNFWVDSGIAVGTNGILYACGTESRLVALGWDGTFKWEFKTKGRTLNRAAPVISSDGTIYFASGDGMLYALNADGTQKWAVDTVGAISTTPILAEDGTIYVAGNGVLTTVSPEGKIVETIGAGAPGESSPTLAADGTLYVVTSVGKITAFAGSHGGLMNSAWPKFQGDLANSGRGH